MHDLADEAATETMAEAAQEAEVVQAVADAGAEVILSEKGSATPPPSSRSGSPRRPSPC